MAGYAQSFNLVVIFFVYGLAFFVMGLSMTFEARRAPLLAEASVLLSLAVFGLVHGAHEWLEMSLIVREWFGFPIPESMPLIRLAFLVVSFSALLLYGLQVLKPNEKTLTRNQALGGLGLFLAYVLLVLIAGLVDRSTTIHWVERADSLSRYLLAFPGAVLATLALESQARNAYGRQRQRLGSSLRLAAISFGLYSLTQLVVSASDLLPARYINSALFIEWTGIPIQLVRAFLAAAITYGLVRASGTVELERQEQLQNAQQARLQAMERVHVELLEREAMRKELLRHIVMAQEDERTRIARELHDETAQFLTALTLNLATLQRKIPSNPNLVELLERLQSLSRQMSQGIYRMVRDLRPAQLDDLGLVAALRYLCDDARQRGGLQVKLRAEGERRLDPLVETVIFRVAQEALNNVIRHAGCDSCEIQIEFHENQVTLKVQDEGIGFDPADVSAPQFGLGLAGMRERVDSVGGEFILETEPGVGTLITLTIPVTNDTNQKNEEQMHAYHTADAG